MSSKDSMNFYELLGVSPSADVATIEKAFRAISLARHPDRANAATRPKSGVESQTEKEAREKRNHERYVQIVEARDTLVDSRKREAYDRKEGIRDASANNNRTWDYQGRTESKSKSKSGAKSTTGPRAGASTDDDLIESYIDSMVAEVSSIEHMDGKVHNMLYTLESATRRSAHGPDYSGTVTFLSSILRNSRNAKEDIYGAIGDLKALGRRTVSDSEKRSKAEKIYDSAINGVLSYIHLAEKTVEEMEAIVAPLEESRRR